MEKYVNTFLVKESKSVVHYLIYHASADYRLSTHGWIVGAGPPPEIGSC